MWGARPNHEGPKDSSRKSVLALALVILLLPIAVLNGLLHLDHEPHLCALLGFAFVLHVLIRPGLREICADAGAGCLLLLAYSSGYGLPHSDYGPAFTALTYAGLLGAGSLCVLTVQMRRTTGEERERRGNALAAGLIAPVGIVLIGYPLQISALMHPRTFDTFLYSFDLSLGWNPSFLLGQAFARFGPLRAVSSFVYDTLPLVVSFFYAALKLQKKQFRVNVILLFTGGLLLGSLLYNVCPATGPLYAFGPAFPMHPPAMGEFVVQPLSVPAAPRNGMPSLHVALALMVFWNAYVWGRKGRILAGFYLLFTVLATLGTGEHYLIDLVVGVPFAVAMQALFTTDRPLRDPSRWRPLIVASAITALWLMVLRSPVILLQPAAFWPWIAIALTLALCWFGKRTLDSPVIADHEPALAALIPTPPNEGTASISSLS